VKDGEVGIYVCTGGFTKDADEFARSQARRRITLLDAERLVELWVQFYPKLSDVAGTVRNFVCGAGLTIMR